MAACPSRNTPPEIGGFYQICSRNAMPAMEPPGEAAVLRRGRRRARDFACLPVKGK
jgi:hypothetical protein